MINQDIKIHNSRFDTFKFNKYMAMYPFNDTDAFNQWLEINELTYDQFLLWFDKDNITHNSMEDCPWINYLMNSYKPAANIKHKYENPFGVFIDFIVEKATFEHKQRVAVITNTNKTELNCKVFENIFIKELTQSLISIIMPTLTLELNVARISNQLKSNSSEGRFNEFIELLTNKEHVLNTYKEYPILLEKLIIQTENSLAQSIEFYTRLNQDYQNITSVFGLLGSFIGFSDSSGDHHNDGRSVRVCIFENVKIVYKPRCLKADNHFQKLLSSINHESKTTFKTILNIEKKDYGWSQHVGYKQCKTIQELQKYYISIGHYIALLYVLNSSDFHHENIIACGESPVLIDLESIFHVDLTHETQDKCGVKNLNSNIHTVLDSLILPHKIYFSGQQSFIDISALGYKENQTFSASSGSILNINRDDMTFESKTGQSAASKNNPSSNGSFGLINSEISELICQGFKSLYTFFQNRPNWIFYNKYFIALTESKFRCILKPTQGYMNLINNEMHPDYLRSHRDRFLASSQMIWDNVKGRNYFHKVSAYEIDCISRGNVPIYHFYPTSPNLTSGNNENFNDFFYHTTLDNIKNTYNRLSDKDMKAQMWIIKSSMLTNQPPKKTENYLLHYHNKLTIDNYCHSITKELIDISIETDKGLNWINLHLINATDWTLSKHKESELYDGSLGTLLYLSYYAKIYNENDLQELIKKSIVSLCEKLPKMQLKNIGGFTGLGGVIYGLTKIYKVNNLSIIPKTIKQLTTDICKEIQEDKCFDVMGGSAGAILALLCAYEEFNDKALLDCSHICANHLLENFNDHGDKCGWHHDLLKIDDLGGFSHGVTGIGYSLIQLFQVSKNQAYLDCAIKAFKFEDSLFDPNINNYTDLRDKNSTHNADSGMVAWCHGSIGIGLARMELIKGNYLPELTPQFKNEIPRTISKALELSLNINQSLCHGDAGTLEYLFQVSNEFHNIYSKENFNLAIDNVVKCIANNGQKNGLSFNGFYPGLMMGSIGLAYQLLRFNNPTLVGNILLLK